MRLSAPRSQAANKLFVDGDDDDGDDGYGGGGGVEFSFILIHGDLLLFDFWWCAAFVAADFLFLCSQLVYLFIRYNYSFRLN